MDNIILPGGKGGPIPPEFQGQRVQAIPVIPKEIKEAQENYIEEGKFLLENIQERINNTEDFDNIVILTALKWIIKGQLPLSI